MNPEAHAAGAEVQATEVPYEADAWKKEACDLQYQCHPHPKSKT